MLATSLSCDHALPLHEHSGAIRSLSGSTEFPRPGNATQVAPLPWLEEMPNGVEK